jgi:[ribosomal protein S5]-alanine N-acetyltransferase
MNPDTGYIIFETSRLRVRRYTKEDTDNFFRLSGDAQVMQYIRPVSGREESDKFLLENIRYYQDNPTRGRWAVIEKSSKDFVGSFAIIPIPSMPEKIQLGYSLIPSRWGLGYATELSLAGLDYFFENESLDKIYGVTDIPNLASQRVLLKAGFEKAGSFMEEGKKLLLFINRRSQRN